LILGSSLVKNAFVDARKRPGGVILSLQRIGVNIWWQGRSELTLRRLKDHIKIMLRYEDPPSKLVIHIGGNDIGKVRLGYLQYQLKELFVWLSQLMPDTAFIWSNMLPRLQ
jgi:lysophospholipase L1-like esterase